MINKFDENKDNTINENELVQIIRELNRKEELRQVFK